MMHGFESVEHELDQKRLQLEQELVAVRGREAELQADLERVHEALGALTGHGHGHKKKSKSRSRARKPATSVHDLHDHIAHVRSTNPFADAAELEKGVRARVQESGSSLANFKALFAEALLTSPGSVQGHAHGTSHSQHSHHGHAHGSTSSHGSPHAHADEEDRYSA
jgi:hypothetical protein